MRISQALFKDFMKKSRSISGDFLLLRYGLSSDTNRYAFVAPKTVAKTAVDRNKLKRRGYSAIRELKLSPGSPYLLAFFFKKTKKLPTYAEIKAESAILLKKIHAL